jgi:GT2 family glycosyltransferase
MVDSIDAPVEHLVIIDNGGEAGPAAKYKTDKITRVTLLSLPSNLGVSGSWNLGVKLLPHEPVWYFTSNDVTFRPGGIAQLATAKTTRLTLSAMAPHWQTFALGEDVVKRVGLFDERFYPAYFEDNDYARRVEQAGLLVDVLPIHADHANSSTLNSEERFQRHNGKTFESNARLYYQKLEDSDNSWSWDLDRRRAGEWLVD